VSERTQWQRIARRIRVPLGFIFAAVFLWLARPTWQTMLVSLLLVVPGVWLRAYAAGYVRKNAELTRTGPYAHTRNPLYLGSMMIAFGFAAAAASWIIFIALAILFAAIYLPTIRSEELYLREHFPGFDEYAKNVPRLLPRLTAAPTTDDRGSFSSKLYLHHREYNASMGAIAIYAALAARLLFLKR
jgi:protein-S-isoprenylcysteine O-methyltransferase Ste14